MTTVAAEAQSSCSVIAAVAEPGACFARSAASGSFAGPPTATRRRRDAAPSPKTSFSSRELKRPWFRPDPIVPVVAAYVKALFDRKKPGWVGYPGIFFDQQLAACATIAFVKNEGSTFSNFINELRKDNLSETCNHGMDSP